jgi:hypothetical protein
MQAAIHTARLIAASCCVDFSPSLCLSMPPECGRVSHCRSAGRLFRCTHFPSQAGQLIGRMLQLHK